MRPDPQGAMTRLGTKLGPKAVNETFKAFGGPSAPTAGRGASEPSFQAQRTGERADFSSALPAAPMTVSAPGSFPMVQPPTMPINTPYSPDMTFSMPSMSGGGVAPGATGVEAAAPGASTAGGGMSVAGGLGAGAGGAAALAAILGAIAQATGDEKLAKAAQATGAAGGALATGGGVAGGVASGGGFGAGTGAAAAGTGIGTAAGAAFAPVAAGILAASIANMINPGSAPEVSDLWTGGKVDPYLNFYKDLGMTLGKERGGLNSVMSALPYVQSTEDLATLLSDFRTNMGESIGGYGEGVDPFTIAPLPGAGGSKHEGGQIADFSDRTSDLNQVIAALREKLPASGGGQALYNIGQTNAERASKLSGLDQSMGQYLGEPQRAEYEKMLSDLQPIGYGDPSSAWQSMIQPQAAEAPAGSGAMPGATPGAGAMDPGSAAGGAGKRMPQFLTPEIDNRAEAMSGKRGGQPGAAGDEGVPFGMAGRRGGMGVGGAPKRQEGGRPGGQAPFGGMAKQTMMPAQGGGIQARKQGQRGTV